MDKLKIPVFTALTGWSVTKVRPDPPRRPPTVISDDTVRTIRRMYEVENRTHREISTAFPDISSNHIWHIMHRLRRQHVPDKPTDNEKDNP